MESNQIPRKSEPSLKWKHPIVTAVSGNGDLPIEIHSKLLQSGSTPQKPLGKGCRMALEGITRQKSTVTNTPVLHPKHRISVDASSSASSSGMGAILLQEQHPIAYASKSLTTSQKNYAQIKKEVLAIVFGCNKFHDYIYGLPNIVVETNHKPLESILHASCICTKAKQDMGI